MESLEAYLRHKATSSESTPENVEWLAKLGAFLARSGKLKDAEHVVEIARAMSRADVRSATLLMIAESQIAYYRYFGRDSLDRIRRAYLLAKQFNVSEIALCAASHYAHIAYNFSEYAQAEEPLILFGEKASSADDSDKARVFSVIADSSQYIGDWALSRTFYDAARTSSRKARDGVMTSSIEYNRLVSGLARVRVNAFLVRPEPIFDTRMWSVEIDTVANIHQGYENQALLHLIDLCRARHLEHIGNFGPAGEIVAQLVEQGAAQACGLTEGCLRLEACWCFVKANIDIKPVAEMSSLLWESFDGLDPDDQIACLSMSRDLYEMGSMDFNPEELQARLKSSTDAYDESVRKIRSMLDKVSPSTIKF